MVVFRAMQSIYEKYIFSPEFADLCIASVATVQKVVVTSCHMVNNGLTNVIFIIESHFYTKNQLEKRKIVGKFYLESQALASQNREFAILSFLRDKDFLVPAPLFKGQFQDVYFLIMDYVAGIPFDTVFSSYSKEQQYFFVKQALSFMHNLHTLPIAEVQSYLSKYTTALGESGYIGNFLTSMSSLIQSSGLIEFSCLFDWLVDHKPEAKDHSICVVHGDFHPYNMILSGTEDLFVLDWNSFSFGIPEIDIGWFAFVTAGIAGKDMEEQILQEYNAQSPVHMTTSDLEYYMFLCSGFRLVVFAIILNDIEGVRNNDPSYKNRILHAYKDTIKYILERIKELLGFTFPSLETKLVKA